MKNAKVLLFVALTAVLLAGAVTWVRTGSSTAAAQERVIVRDHWRHHAGHWSYWHEGDKRWYYTDGSHWFYHDGDAWKPYRFDRKFGREGFERGEYRIPGEDVKIVVPRHEIYRPR